ncbi:MAG: NADH-quinone oxidoreductase subunit C, partial [Anaerolineales bacterium]|nr:NADH-quinone oxidoreductase subunit C [Anaerolineales bacterium]
MSEQELGVGSAEQATVAADPIVARFDGALRPDERKGYEGYIVAAGRLPEVATVLRDELGYDYLSSVTGVDYIDEGQLEIVYHAYQTSGGPALNLKVQVDRENPVLSSLVSVYPGADFQEREIFDLYGVRFEGHPNLR